MKQPGGGILNSSQSDSNICDICALKDWEQESWEQAVISCDQTTDSTVASHESIQTSAVCNTLI